MTLKMIYLQNMDWIIKIRPRAVADLEAATGWYNDKNPALGSKMLTEVDTAIKILKSRPYSFRFIYNPVRRLVLKKFPYKILFIINDTEIIILGIVHHKRSNRYVKRSYK